MDGDVRYIKKYGLYIEKEEWWNPLHGRYCTTYKMYTADGCCWDKGISWKGVQNEIRQYGKIFLDIKNSCNGRSGCCTI